MRGFLATYQLVLNQLMTRARLFGALGVLAVSMLIAFAALRDGSTRATVEFLHGFGLSLVAPVGALLIGASVFGDMRDDETLVYIWLRAASRASIVLGAMAAAMVVALPTIVLPMVAVAYIGRGDVVWATFQAFVLAGLAYTSLFVLAGLVVRRTLLWGLLYIFIWEFFVARGGFGAARLSINTYPTSLLARETGVQLALAERSALASGLVPLAVTAVCTLLAIWRLRTMRIA